MGEYNEASHSRMMVQDVIQQNNKISMLYKDAVDFESYHLMLLLRVKMHQIPSHV